MGSQPVPTPTSKTSDFLGRFNDIWGGAGAAVSGRCWGLRRVRAGIEKKTYFQLLPEGIYAYPRDTLNHSHWRHHR